MQLQEEFKKWASKSAGENSTGEKVLTHDLGLDLPKIGAFSSLKQFQESQIFQVLKTRVDRVTSGYEYGCYAENLNSLAPAKPFYRAVLWNLDHGRHFDGILETLRNRALVSRADIYFFPCVDIGRERSGNRNVARNLAMELGYNYFFAATFLNIPSSTETKNQLGIEGHAILTRLPLSNLRVVPFLNGPDPLKGPDRKLGCEKALLADMTTEKGKVTLVCLNLSQSSSQRERAAQIKSVVERLKTENRNLPVLIAGDLKTTTYNGRAPFWFFFSVLNKLFRGYDYIRDEHHGYPEKYFEKRMFDALTRSGFDFGPFNECGKATLNLSVSDFFELFHFFGRYSNWLGQRIAKYTDTLQLKTDWFVANNKIQISDLHESERPKVISFLYHEGKSISPHDPVLLDFTMRS